MTEYEGNLISKSFKYAIIVSRFNDFITGRLLEGAKDALIRSGGEEKDFDVIKVPGCFEIPLADFVKVNPGFNPEELHQVAFVFDRTAKGVVVLDDIGFRNVINQNI